MIAKNRPPVATLYTKLTIWVGNSDVAIVKMVYCAEFDNSGELVY